MLRVVILNLKADAGVAYRGVLWRYRGGWFVLRDVALLHAQGNATPFDGEMVVHRANVSYLQVLP
jgi:hypothetical protein